MFRRMKEWIYDTAAAIFYPINWDEFWDEEKRIHKRDMIMRDCIILEEKIKEAKRKKQKHSHYQREFVSKTAELIRGK